MTEPGMVAHVLAPFPAAWKYARRCVMASAPHGGLDCLPFARIYRVVFVRADMREYSERRARPNVILSRMACNVHTVSYLVSKAPRKV